MKITTIADLESTIKKSYHHAYLCVSKESFDLSAIKKLLASQKDTQVETFNSEGINSRELKEELETLTFFHERKLIILENSEKINADIAETLKAFISSPPPKTILLLLGSTKPRSTSLLKQLDKDGIILEIAEPKPWEKQATIIHWIKSQAREKQKTIDEKTALLLTENIGFEKAILDQELEKLACYIGERKNITTEDIKAIVISSSNKTIWQWRDAILTRQTSQAIKIGHSLLENSSIQALLASLRAQIQTAYQICHTLDNGGTPQDITAIYPYLKGNLLSRTINMTKSYGSQHLKKALIAINNTDNTSKSQTTSHEILLDILITKITI